MTLYEQLGEETVRKVITEFYLRAFADPIIGHLFLNIDINHITAFQIDFATNMLGGPKRYSGKSLAEAHHALKLRPPHFGRRQIIMRDVLDEMVGDVELRNQWLKLEDQLRPIILNLR